jgi:hypothetical protein
MAIFNRSKKDADEATVAWRGRDTARNRFDDAVAAACGGDYYRVLAAAGKLISSDDQALPVYLLLLGVEAVLNDLDDQGAGDAP